MDARHARFPGWRSQQPGTEAHEDGGMQASQERVSCVNVHECLYVTYNTPISLCTAQLSLKQTPLRIFTFT